MKKVVLIFLSIIALIVIAAFFFKNEFTIWSITNQYKTDPSSIRTYSDIPEEICMDVREEILNAYLVKADTSEKNLVATIDLIKYFRSCSSKPSDEKKTLLYKKSFDVLMNIYAQTKNPSIRYDIADFLKNEDIKAFYKYFEITQENDLLFFDGTTHSPINFPELYYKESTIEKELWCTIVQPKIEASFIALLEADTFEAPFMLSRLLKIYEKTTCNNDVLYLRKLHFSAWSELLVDIEKQFSSFQTSQEIFQLIAAEVNLSYNAKNELEATSLISLVDMYRVPEQLKAKNEKNLFLYILDFPLKSRIMCLNITSYFSNRYTKNSIGADVILKIKTWLKLVDEKYPELGIQEKWQDLVDFQTSRL